MKSKYDLKYFSEIMQKAITESMGVGKNAYSEDDVNLSKAIELSMKGQNVESDYGNPELRKRKDGIPVGLKNVGNSKQYDVNTLQLAISTLYFKLTS